MSIKVAQKRFHLKKLKILTSLQKLPKNVGDLDKLIVAKGFEKLPKIQQSPNLVTLPCAHIPYTLEEGGDDDGICRLKLSTNHSLFLLRCRSPNRTNTVKLFCFTYRYKTWTVHSCGRTASLTKLCRHRYKLALGHGPL